MPKFDDYTQKTIPEDNDIALILDKTANVNKKTPFSGIWTWIVNKMTNAVIQNLKTTNKTVIGSINELNSKSNGYILGITVTSTNVLKFKGRFDSNTLGDGFRQSVFMFGDANVNTVHGVFRIYGSGTVQWRGYVQSGEVTASMDSKGIISVNLPEIAYDTFCLVSAQRITAV